MKREAKDERQGRTTLIYIFLLDFASISFAPSDRFS